MELSFVGRTELALDLDGFIRDLAYHTNPKG